MKVVHGDILQLASQGDFDIVIHGCNCQHAMTGGLALQVAQQFPEAAEVDLTEPYPLLGEFTYIVVGSETHDFAIINAYTQLYAGPCLSYGALATAFENIALYFDRGNRIAYPRIGAGIAGGNWDVIYPLICEILRHHDHTLVEYAP